jgi:hypothetical protein
MVTGVNSPVVIAVPVCEGVQLPVLHATPNTASNPPNAPEATHTAASAVRCPRRHDSDR